MQPQDDDVDSQVTSESRGAYGTSISELKTFISKSTGLRSGFSITLLSNTSEYCGTPLEQGGFIAFVHDNNAEPLMELSTDINLSPGWDTKVAMSLTKTERKTESYGYCKTRMNLNMFKGLVDYSDKDLFTQNCISYAIMATCKCLPFYVPRGNSFMRTNFPEIKFPENSSDITYPSWVTGCGSEVKTVFADIGCQGEVERKKLRSDMPCVAERPKPCRNAEIKTQISATLFPSHSSLSSLKRKYGNLTLEEFRKNFLSVHFYFRSYRYILVTETIKMTWVDLMNQAGGAIGMSLGLSIIGIVELSGWICIRVAQLFFGIIHYFFHNDKIHERITYQC